jgi:hypothetical protein
VVIGMSDTRRRPTRAFTSAFISTASERHNPKIRQAVSDVGLRLASQADLVRLSKRDPVTDDSEHAPSKPTPPSVPDPTRRRLLQGGAAAGPTLYAIATRPARATNFGLCQSPSAFGSLHASGRGEETPTCTGRTPGYWKQRQHFGAWPSPYYPTTVPDEHLATGFHAVGFAGGMFGDDTLLDVLQTGGNEGGYVALARHIAAALLNAASGKTPVLSVADVLNIWNEYVAHGCYEPTAGVRWEAEEIVVYLKTTMPV